VLALEIWFAFRADVVAMARRARGTLRPLYRALTLGSDDVSPRALAYDHKWARALAILGIPTAAGLHGYVGFIFGSLKSREWWSSDLMPIIFLLSAVVSGVALLAVLYVAVWRMRRTELKDDCLRGLAQVMWAFLAVTLVVEALEYVEMFYRAREGIGTIVELIEGPLRPGLLIQGAGSIAAFAVLTVLLTAGTRSRNFAGWLTFSAASLLVAVLAMRWNVVIGGQELSKTLKGLLTYRPELLGREGMLTAALLLVGPLAVLWVLARLLPPWEEARPA